MASVLSPGSFANVAHAADPHQQHEALQSQLAGEREELELLRGQKAEVRAALGVVQELGARSSALAKRFGNELQGLQKQIAHAESREAKARVELDSLIRKLSPRLAAMYRITRRGALAVLLDAKDVSGLLKRRRALEQLLGADLELLGRAQKALEVQARALDELDGLKLAVARRRELLSDELGRQEKRRLALTELFETLDSDVRSSSQLVGELQRQERQLSALLERLDNIPDTGFGALRGNLASPVTGGFLESRFGRMVNPRSNTLVFKKGVDLRAPHGTPVMAVAPGRVVYAAPYRSYGNLLVIDHGDGFHSVMAHLAAFTRAVGEAVEEGETVGLVGDTGSEKGAYLYFELRQNGFAIDPMQWFAQL